MPGNPGAGRVVREPSASKQQRRYYTRHRSHLVGLRGKMEGHGAGGSRGGGGEFAQTGANNSGADMIE